MRVASLLVLLLVLATALGHVWIRQLWISQAEEEMLEKSRVLSQQMAASWEFIEINQRRIDTDADGSYNFKGIYCAIAGQSIGKIFMRDTDYTTRYVGESPRNPQAQADDFEQRALDSFSNGASSYYEITDYEGSQAFRYVTPIRIEDSCLSCHGGPVGEVDITGYPKEGLEVGDINGAISIVMPVETYMEGIDRTVMLQSLMLSATVFAMIAVVYVAINRLIIRPLDELQGVTRAIGEGNLQAGFEPVRANDEIGELSECVSSMSRQLFDLYEDLEGLVELRTEQLASANEMLEDQKAQLAEANVRLMSESKYKSDFLANVSHELRTPLTSIVAFIEIWESSNEPRNEDEALSMQEIKASGKTLLNMVDNILELANAETGNAVLQYESVDLVDVFSVVERNVTFFAKKKGVELSLSLGDDVPIIETDFESIRRIIENLVSNAIKFSHRGGTVMIEIEHDSARAELSISVSDEGIGIEDKDIPLIFERFVRLSHGVHDLETVGSGVGLTVVRESVDALGGDIFVESVVGVGSRFTVSIPTMGVREDRENENHAG